MFAAGVETMNLPLEEKMKFEQGDSGRSAGYVCELLWDGVLLLFTIYHSYKAHGSSATDEKGSKDNAEFINIAKDDALNQPASMHIIYPSTVIARMKPTITPFVRKSIEVNNTILGIFEQRLGLAAGTLLKYHTDDDPSGSEARVIKSPPRTAEVLAQDPEKVALRAHTDFGSLSFLHNQLGGLQVLPPGSERWQYVRPMSGHAICNVGDALTIFSGGLLHSNMHRVVPPPGVQAAYDRWSLVFFTRPGNEVQLHALVDESALIKEVVETKSMEQRAKYFPNTTAGEWFQRRVKYTRLQNMTVCLPATSLIGLDTCLMPCHRVLRCGRMHRAWSMHQPEDLLKRVHIVRLSIQNLVYRLLYVIIYETNELLRETTMDIGT